MYEEYEFKIDTINAYGEATHRPFLMPSKKLYTGTDPSSIRHRILIDTLFYCATHDMKALDVIAGKNVKRKKSPNEYIVMNNDWGVSLSYLTKKHGYTFAVINMANAVVFGGGYVGGASAQEENMFRRTNCFFFMDYEGEPILKDGKYYTEKMKHLIDAKDNRGNIIDNGHVYLDMRPRLYLFGEETKEPGLGYKQLDEILPFFELRSAAIDLRRKPSNYERDTKSRIRAQFNTLIEKGCEHVILSAFGCGAFGNDPKDISSYYNQVLKEDYKDMHYKDFFKVICFSIIPNPGQGENNFEVFKDRLVGFKEQVIPVAPPIPSLRLRPHKAVSPVRESSIRNSFNRKPSIRNPSIRNSPTRNSSIRNSPTRNSFNRKPSIRNSSIRNSFNRKPSIRNPSNLNNFLNIFHKPLQYGYNTGKKSLKNVVGSYADPMFNLVEAPYTYGVKPIYHGIVKPAYHHKWYGGSRKKLID